MWKVKDWFDSYAEALGTIATVAVLQIRGGIHQLAGEQNQEGAVGLAKSATGLQQQIFPITPTLHTSPPLPYCSSSNVGNRAQVLFMNNSALKTVSLFCFVNAQQGGKKVLFANFRKSLSREPSYTFFELPALSSPELTAISLQHEGSSGIGSSSYVPSERSLTLSAGPSEEERTLSDYLGNVESNEKLTLNLCSLLEKQLSTYCSGNTMPPQEVTYTSSAAWSLMQQLSREDMACDVDQATSDGEEDEGIWFIAKPSEQRDSVITESIDKTKFPKLELKREVHKKRKLDDGREETVISVLALSADIEQGSIPEELYKIIERLMHHNESQSTLDKATEFLTLEESSEKTSIDTEVKAIAPTFSHDDDVDDVGSCSSEESPNQHEPCRHLLETPAGPEGEPLLSPMSPNSERQIHNFGALRKVTSLMSLNSAIYDLYDLDSSPDVDFSVAESSAKGQKMKNPDEKSKSSCATSSTQTSAPLAKADSIDIFSDCEEATWAMDVLDENVTAFNIDDGSSDHTDEEDILGREPFLPCLEEATTSNVVFENGVRSPVLSDGEEDIDRRLCEQDEEQEPYEGFSFSLENAL